MFVEAAGGKFVEVKTRQEDFQIDFSALEQAITEKTKAVLLNSPNNPSGVIISEENIIRLAALLNKRSAFYFFSALPLSTPAETPLCGRDQHPLHPLPFRSV